MGSTASKGLSRRTATWLETKMEQMQAKMDADSLRDIAQKQADAGEGGFIDPSARDYGFTRGYGRQHKGDIQQAHYLEQRATALGRHGSEMPPELIKFLTDMGPLERTMDSQMSSTRLLRDDGIVHQMERGDSQRTIRDMPLKGDEMNHTTRRTTNFGSAVKEVDAQDFGCRDWQLYEMIRQKDTIDVDAYWNDVNKAQDVTNDVRVQQVEMLKNAINFIELPAIMKDKKDKTYLGIWPNDLEELKADPDVGHLYESVSEDRIQFCISEFKSIDEMEDNKELLKQRVRQ